MYYYLLKKIIFLIKKKEKKRKRKEGGKLVYIKINILGQVVLCSVLVVWGGFYKRF